MRGRDARREGTEVVQKADTDEGNAVSETVDEAVDENPWLERVMQWGWIAKGVVYTLMGVTTMRIAQQSPVADDASPDGSIKTIAQAPFGRSVLAVLTIGLVLYAIWRFLSVALITENDVSGWGDRIGYTFSGAFYSVLAYAAGKAAITGIDPEESSTVEDLSASVLDVTAGRTTLGIAGAVTICVGVYFAVHKGLQRSFAKHLDGVEPKVGDNQPKRRALLIAGVVGWIGRGFVTALVGFFVLRAAVLFDPSEARGFDKALREIADTSTGSKIVFACAIGLIAYGVFCFFSHRFRFLDESHE